VASTDLKDSIAFLGTYPPRQCGIATFTHDVLAAVGGQSEGRLGTVALAIDDPREPLNYPDEVVHVIQQYDAAEYVRAAEFLNFHGIRAVGVQHEFGIFGGPDGAYLLDFVRELRCPIVTTFHTVLRNPTEGQRAVMREIIVLSSRLVVMSHKAVGFLREVYDAPDEKIRFIPHGVPEIPLVEPEGYKRQFDMEGRELMLTFGLLSPGKGIEYAVRALPPVVEQYPNFCYMVLGATHPNVLREHGEDYRFGLQRLARNLGLQKNVLFSDQYVDLDRLCEFLKASDFYVTPYLNREQITSGTLAYAVGAGKPVISTPYWHAEELLADGRGVLVDFSDPEGISEALLRLLANPAKMRLMRAGAYEYSRGMTWREVGRQYLEAFRGAISLARVSASVPDVSMRYTLPITGLPRPRLEHVVRLTDETGILQHARHAVPDRAHGYCTDDNARALIVASQHWRLFRDPESERLLSIYLAFMAYAQRDDGWFHNFMSYDRHFLDEAGSDDCYGRALWGLSYTMCRGPAAYFAMAKELFEKALKNLTALSLRGRSYAMLGLYYYLQCYPEAEDVVQMLDALATEHREQYDACAHRDWPWFEDIVAYDNATVPQSLFLAYEVTGKAAYRDVARQSLDFLLEMCVRGDHISLVGNDGWHVRGGHAATFDQQPLDACGLVGACKAAFRVTGRRDYLRAMRMSYDWFLGVNDVDRPLYSFKTGGCSDGLHRDGVNLNQGAESTLSCLIALLTLCEMFSEQDRAFRGMAPARGVNPSALP